MKELCIFLLYVVIVSCGNPAADSSQAHGQGTLPPVETESPNADYKPSFTGQTRIAGITTKAEYNISILNTRLQRPWGITVLPDGRFLITEKAGNMRIVTSNGTMGEKILGIPAVNDDGQGGLLGVVADPDFKTNRMVYWVFSERTREGNLTAVAKGRLSADEKTMEQVKIIYRAIPAHNSTLHYGGRILIDKANNLLVSTGERSDLETRPLAQSLQAALGKIIRITKEGKPAEGNPFIKQENALPELYSYGHRNVQGLAWHPQTGDLWENEFGPRGGDELNVIKPGKNYGWPVITYGIEYSGGKIGSGITQKTGMEQPVYYWDPVLSPSGMTFCSSDAIPEWKNDLFICGLSSMHIARLKIVNNKVVGEERLLVKEKQRFRDITQGKDGALYAITDQGRMYRIGK